MTKFKVGDKVQYLGGWADEFIHIGSIGVVINSIPISDTILCEWENPKIPNTYFADNNKWYSKTTEMINLTRLGILKELGD